MAEEPKALVRSLIAELTKALQLEIRVAPTSGEHLEAVLKRPDLSRCFELLSQALGPPAKEFGKPATFDPELQRVVDALGGIRMEQCLFVKPLPQRHLAYAALWPWASDPTKVTIKVGAAPPP